MTEPVSSHQLELRRGYLVLACLQALEDPIYGYGLLKDLRSAGIAIEGDTLYPLLRRLESQGLLTSVWNTEQSRPRKFYVVTDAGRQLGAGLWQEYTDLSRSLELVRERKSHDRIG
ncbi:PadR family transcriptional regulator [Microbacterium aurugineum]